MVWAQLSATKPHIAYALLGGFITFFSLISLFVKERLYIGEATVAMVVGIIFGPIAANIFDPYTWGNVDYITLEVARIVIVVQVFAVGVELPKKYLKRHWRGVAIMLLPVMTASWFICAAFIYAFIPKLNFVESLVIAATLAPTDPVLASSVVGKGKFAERVPGHIRNLLSCESGCNDGMAFPFLYLGLYIILDVEVTKTAKEWILITILYECLLGIVLGVLIGYGARRAIRYAESHKLIDRESFLVFYFVLALFCTGIGTVIGVDDFLVAFAAGAAFAWDGWFSRKTEESHVSNVIDLLLNMAFFVYFGAIIPWSLFNNPELSITPWRLIVISILILLFRRIPAVFAFYKFNPDIRNWREALFCGHFGPMGVGALFFAILARAELETESQVPAGRLPGATEEHGLLINAIYPIVTFVVLASIIVHGSSIAVFTLGKHINTNVLPTMSMTFTRGRGSEDEGPQWLNRLPRLEFGHSMTFQKSRDRSRARDEAGGHIDKSAIGSAILPTARRRGRRADHRHASRDRSSSRHDPLNHPDDSEKQPSDRDLRTEDERVAARQYEEERDHDLAPSNPHYHEDGQQVFREGDQFIVEDELGEVIKVVSNPQKLNKTAAHNLLDKDEKLDEVSKGDREEIARDPSHPLYTRLKGFVSGLKGAHDSSPGSKNDKSLTRKASTGQAESPNDDTTNSSSTAGKSEEQLRRLASQDYSDEEETQAERRRRRAALGINGDEDEEEETPAERRRRLEALGHSTEPASDHPSTQLSAQDHNGEEAQHDSTPNRSARISFHESVEQYPSRGRGARSAIGEAEAASSSTGNLLTVPEHSARSSSHSRSRSIAWADNDGKR